MLRTRIRNEARNHGVRTFRWHGHVLGRRVCSMRAFVSKRWCVWWRGYCLVPGTPCVSMCAFVRAMVWVVRWGCGQVPGPSCMFCSVRCGKAAECVVEGELPGCWDTLCIRVCVCERKPWCGWCDGGSVRFLAHHVCSVRVLLWESGAVCGGGGHVHGPPCVLHAFFVSKWCCVAAGAARFLVHHVCSLPAFVSKRWCVSGVRPGS